MTQFRYYISCFVAGIGKALEFTHESCLKAQFKEPNTTDYEAIKNDWKVVGHELFSAIEKCSTHSNEKTQASLTCH